MIYLPINYTVECVLEGHPDKICDQICDAILDEYLQKDDSAKVAIECLGTASTLVLGGEIFSKIKVDVESIASSVYQQIGYNDSLSILNIINRQSVQLRQVVLMGAAGDQGVMYGFACDNGSSNLLPYGVYLINSVAKEIDLLRKASNLYLPDGKIQMTFKHDQIDTLIISIQHFKNSDVSYLRRLILENVVSKFVPVEEIRTILFNHNSSFLNGGFSNDTGLSGRKIISDTYGGLVPHGGGSFSGKDPSKVDRSASYMARFVAKNIVANNLAKACLVSVAYAFGVEYPVMINVQTENKINDTKIEKLVRDKFDFRPTAIIERLNLTKINYRRTSTYGHFSDCKYTWEQTIDI